MDFRNRVKQETERSREAERNGQTERANPESHGNLATSAIGRTCTRSNLKLRSRTSPAILSFVRVIRIYVYPFIAFGYVYTLGERERVRKREAKDLTLFLFVIYRLSTEQAPPGTAAEVLSLCQGTGVPLFSSPTFACVNKRSATFPDKTLNSRRCENYPHYR